MPRLELEKYWLVKIGSSMTNKGRGGKTKISYTATPDGVKRAEKALKRLGFRSKSNFAESILMSRATVTKFFNQTSIQLDSFQRICDKLTLNWMEIADLPELSKPQLVRESILSKVAEVQDLIPTFLRKITVVDKQGGTTKAVITLQGDLDSANLSIIQAILKEYGGDTIVIEDIREGSIKIYISGSPEDIKRIESLITSGELEAIDGCTVENFEVITDSPKEETTTESSNKWRLVEEIVNQPAGERDLIDLINVDLSDADLREADLRGAELSGANLEGANLVLADLRGAELEGAVLAHANLEGANLTDAVLEGANLARANLTDAVLEGANLVRANLTDAVLWIANLEDANLEGAEVKGARFGYNRGLSEEAKQDLKARGAIFEEPPRDRAATLTPV